MGRDQVNKKLKTLDKWKRKHEEEIRSIETEKEIATSNRPKYKYHHQEIVQLDEDVDCRVGYMQTTYPVDSDKYPKGKKLYGVDIRKWNTERNKPLYHGQGILIPAEKWILIYEKLTSMTIKLYEPSDWIDTLKNIIQETIQTYPREFASAFSQENIPIANSQKQVGKNDALMPSVQKPDKPKSLIDTNWEALKNSSKKKIETKEDSWIAKNL